MKKRRLCLLLSLALCLTLTACGAGEESPPQQQKPAASSYSLKLLAVADADREGTYQTLVDSFLERYPYFSVTLTLADTAELAVSMLQQQRYDIIFTDTVAAADCLYESDLLAPLDEYWDRCCMDEQLSGLILPHWQRRYAIPLFLKLQCVLSDTQTPTPVERVGSLTDAQVRCIALAPGDDGVVDLSCTCTAMGKDADTEQAELFLDTLYSADMLCQCVSRTGIPLACRVSLADATLPTVTQDLYRLLSDPETPLRYSE